MFTVAHLNVIVHQYNTQIVFSLATQSNVFKWTYLYYEKKNSEEHHSWEVAPSTLFFLLPLPGLHYKKYMHIYLIQKKKNNTHWIIFNWKRKHTSNLGEGGAHKYLFQLSGICNRTQYSRFLWFYSLW